MLLNRIGEILCLDGQDIGAPGAPLLEFSVNQFGERFHPRGDQYLRRFDLNDLALWEYEIEGVRVVKELQVPWLKNVAAVRYTVEAEPQRRVQLNLLPFVSLRDFHSARRAPGTQFEVRPADRGVAVRDAQLGVHVWSDDGGARFVHKGDWWYGHTYAIERERGLDDTEDLFSPGRFVVEGTGRIQITLWSSVDPPEPFDWDSELTRRREAVSAAARIRENVQPASGPPVTSEPTSPTLKRLARAANDFVVYRKAPDGTDGTSVIAGYPWFADWGRDTMISLPGLLLVTGRFRQAKQVLSVFANYTSEGMIPNRFDDYTNEPHYNTVDASLWFIHAAFEYLRLSHDGHTFETVLLPACRAIIKGYRAGTRFGIKMDETDALVTQGDASTQLTWMDAKCDGIAFTPRQGKAVEINALWYNALVLMNERELAARVAESFAKAFWVSPFRGLADVVDGSPDRSGRYPRRDTAIRPNQIFAASLPHSPLTAEQQSAVVEVVRRELLTPVGLRTLNRADPNYHGRFTGPPRQRDEAYHNGTIWPWPIGAFLEAYLRVHQRSADSLDQARRWLQPLIDHLERDACIGQISECFEADEPHRPGACPAQAWSVAEVLRLAVELGM
jgi:predicted glycogen debranching enzyme